MHSPIIHFLRSAVFVSRPHARFVMRDQLQALSKPRTAGEPPEPLGRNTKVNMGAQHTNTSTSDVEPPIHSHTQRVLESRLAGASEAVKLSTLGTWARKLRYLAVLHRGSHPLLPFFFSRYFSPHVFSTSPHARPQEGSSHQLPQAVYAVVLTKAHNTACNFR